MGAAIIALVVAATLAPFIAFRGRTLRRYLAFDVASYAVTVAVWRIAPPFDPYLGLVAFGVAKLAAFSVVLAAGDDVKWSANRAALIAALVYALVIPTQMRTPIDGDEPYYLLMTESLIHDRDLDLANQYRHLRHSATGRLDLVPQLGDPVGRHGERYSRHEPFLAFLLIPGYLIGRLPGALATIALFAVLLVRSTIRLLEDEGISDRDARALFPIFAFGPPVVFYAARIWPEVPGALFFVEAVRGIRQRRSKRWLPALLALVLLKLRFLLVGVILVARVLWDRRSRALVIAAMVLLVPIAIVWSISGSVTNVHSWRELLPFPAQNYAIGFFGLLTDGAAGFLFQAPLYLGAIFALARWRSMPEGFRLGCLAAVLYILYLLPRSEWHGGWSPPLRYVAILIPILALGAAVLIERKALLVVASLWTIGLTIHGLAYPWRLFHIANGENPVGEWLSELYRSDFSRLFPSLIRLNSAAIVASAAIVVAFALFMFVRVSLPQPIVIAAIALLVAIGVGAGREAGRRVELEDAHVVHHGGELFPEEYTVARFRFRGGWIVRKGESLSFLSRAGSATLEYSAAQPALIELAGRAYPLKVSGSGYGQVRVEVPQGGRVELRCLTGTVNLDRMSFDE